MTGDTNPEDKSEETMTPTMRRDIGRMIARLDAEIKMLDDMGHTGTAIHQYVVGQKRILVDTPWDIPAVMAVFEAKGE
jgi:hypothetical protein